MEYRKLIQIMTFIALIIAIGWFISEPGAEPAIAILAGIGAILAELFEESVSTKRQADLILFSELKQILPSNGSISFINENNMAGFPFKRSKMDDLKNFYHVFNDAEHEFLDSKLEVKKKKLHQLIDGYLQLIAYKTFPTRTEGWSTVPPEWEETVPDKFWETVNEMHDKAQKIVDAHQDLFRTARAKLKC